MRREDVDSVSSDFDENMCPKVVKARKRMKDRKRVLPTLFGLMTHARGRHDSRNVPTPFPSPFFSVSLSPSKSTRERVRTPIGCLRDQ